MLLRLFEYFNSKASFKEYFWHFSSKMLNKRENFTFYLISLLIQNYYAFSLELLGNCTEDYEGQWFTCIKFVGKMNSSSCTRTCSLNNWHQFGLNDFYNFSNGLQIFLKNLTGLDSQLNESGISEWSILDYAGAKNKKFENNICTNVYYNFGDKEWTDTEIGLNDNDFVRKWKNKFQNVWYQSKKDRFAIEPYQPDAIVLPRRDSKMEF